VDLLPLLEDTLTLRSTGLLAQTRASTRTPHYTWRRPSPWRRRQDQTGVLEFLRKTLSVPWPRRGAQSLSRAGRGLQVNFADTGPGMSASFGGEDFRTLSVAVRRRNRSGLAIVYQIVAAHEGKVWVRSKLGEVRLRSPAYARAVAGSCPPTSRRAATIPIRSRGCRAARPSWEVARMVTFGL